MFTSPLSIEKKNEICFVNTIQPYVTAFIRHVSPMDYSDNFYSVIDISCSVLTKEDFVS